MTLNRQTETATCLIVSERWDLDTAAAVDDYDYNDETISMERQQVSVRVRKSAKPAAKDLVVGPLEHYLTAARQSGHTERVMRVIIILYASTYRRLREIPHTSS
jgi:hypothetical protein